MRHLGKPGTFTCNKVLEKIRPDCPRPGRGPIAGAESVNDPSFGPTDQTRDGLLVGGSDQERTPPALHGACRLLPGD